MKKFSVFVNGQCWHSGLAESEAEDLAAEYRLEGRKYVNVAPDQSFVS